MCRILAYLGEPLPVEHLLFATDNSLVRQSYSPRLMNTFLNLGGFGMKAWDPASLRPEQPFSYRTTTLPTFDRNLRLISAKIASTCLVAHVRGVTYSGEAIVAEFVHDRLRALRVVVGEDELLEEASTDGDPRRGRADGPGADDEDAHAGLLVRRWL